MWYPISCETSGAHEEPKAPIQTLGHYRSLFCCIVFVFLTRRVLSRVSIRFHHCHLPLLRNESTQKVASMSGLCSLLESFIFVVAAEISSSLPVEKMPPK